MEGDFSIQRSISLSRKARTFAFQRKFFFNPLKIQIQENVSNIKRFQ